MDVGLHDDGEEGSVDATPALEDLGEERALAELGDLQLDVSGLGRQQPRAMPVAVVLPLLSSLVRTGTDHRGRLRLDEGLQDELDAVADEVDVAACTECFE